MQVDRRGGEENLQGMRPASRNANPHHTDALTLWQAFLTEGRWLTFCLWTLRAEGLA
jgi:mannose/cellobiose epimerase-like protein (N-acyl-D-glucosamine 2-epimerase family)